MSAQPRFAERIIRDGMVTISGVTFTPQQCHMAYDGRLDGLRYLFGLYYTANEWQREYVFLWGRKDEEADHPDVVDGKLPWLWWEAQQ